MTSRCRRSRMLAALLIVTASAAVACTSSGDVDPSAASTSVPASTTGGPGTPIAAGLDVQPGSHLLGTVFPAPMLIQSPDTRVALVAVDGDPADVTSSYQQALTKLGYRFASTVCRGNPSAGATQICEVPADPSTVSEGSAYLVLAGPSAGRAEFATTLYVSITPRSADPGPSSETSASASAPGTIITSAQAIPGAGVRAVGMASVTIPAVGDPVAARGIAGDARVVVAAGSELLAPAVPINGGLSGWSAVARVSGDPVEVADAYLHQRVWDHVTPAHRRAGAAPVIEGSASVAGGPVLDVESVPVDPSNEHGPWWLLLAVTFD